MALNASDPHGADLDARGDPGLYGLFWRFAGDACAVQPDVANLARGANPKSSHCVEVGFRVNPKHCAALRGIVHPACGTGDEARGVDNVQNPQQAAGRSPAPPATERSIACAEAPACLAARRRRGRRLGQGVGRLQRDAEARRERQPRRRRRRRRPCLVAPGVRRAGRPRPARRRDGRRPAGLPQVDERPEVRQMLLREAVFPQWISVLFFSDCDCARSSDLESTAAASRLIPKP